MSNFTTCLDNFIAAYGEGASLEENSVLNALGLAFQEKIDFSKALQSIRESFNVDAGVLASAASNLVKIIPDAKDNLRGASIDFE